MSRRIRLALILVYLTGGSLAAADWPQWRGPSGTGTTAETGLPVKWSATENIAWKAPIGGLGVSTPIVVGDRVFVTSQLGAGVRQPGNHPRLVQGGNAADAGERALGGARAAALASGAARRFWSRPSTAPTGAGSGSTASRRRASCPASTTSTTSPRRVRSATGRWSTPGSAPGRSSRST